MIKLIQLCLDQAIELQKIIGQNQLSEKVKADGLFERYLSALRTDSSNKILLQNLETQVFKRASAYNERFNKIFNLYSPKKAQGMGSIFDWFKSGSGLSDAELGTKILTAYYNEAISYPNFNYSSLDAFLSFVRSKVSDMELLLGELVRMNVAATTEDEAITRVIDLAKKSQGLATLSQITQAAGGRGDTVNWSAALPEIATGVASDVVDLAADIGQGVRSTLSLTKYLPVILGVGGLAYLYFNKDFLMKFLKRD